jgi:hypothetical protein
MLTVQNSLEVPVGLDLAQIGTNPFVIDLVLGIGEKDKCSDHTLTAATLDVGTNLAVPDIVVVREERSHTVLGHGEKEVSVLKLGVSAVNPIGFGSVAEIFVVCSGIIKVVPLVGLALANGHGGAGIERVRH